MPPKSIISKTSNIKNSLLTSPSSSSKKTLAKKHHPMTSIDSPTLSTKKSCNRDTFNRKRPPQKRKRKRKTPSSTITKMNGSMMKKPSPLKKTSFSKSKISSVSPKTLTISTILNYINRVYLKFNNSLKKKPMKSPWMPIKLSKSRKKWNKTYSLPITGLKNNFRPKNRPWSLKIMDVSLKLMLI